jgi:hypothetical protein
MRLLINAYAYYTHSQYPGLRIMGRQASLADARALIQEFDADSSGTLQVRKPFCQCPTPLDSEMIARRMGGKTCTRLGSYLSLIVRPGGRASVLWKFACGMGRPRHAWAVPVCCTKLHVV